MRTQKIRRVGNGLVLTVPKEIVEKQGLREGDTVGIEIRKMELRPILPPDVRSAFERSWELYEEDYRYLAEH